MVNFNKFIEENNEAVSEVYLSLAIVEKIFEIMERKKINKTELAEKMGISKSEVTRLLDSDRNLTLKVVNKLFNALGEQPVIMTANEQQHYQNLYKTEQTYQQQSVQIRKKDVSFSYPKRKQFFGNMTYCYQK